jgi:hypothetical protein
MARERREVAAQIAKVKTAINPVQQVIGRNVIVEIEGGEPLPMSARSVSHHSRGSLSNALASA